MLRCANIDEKLRVVDAVGDVEEARKSGPAVPAVFRRWGSRFPPANTVVHTGEPWDQTVCGTSSMKRARRGTEIGAADDCCRDGGGRVVTWADCRIESQGGEVGEDLTQSVQVARDGAVDGPAVDGRAAGGSVHGRAGLGASGRDARTEGPEGWDN